MTQPTSDRLFFSFKHSHPRYYPTLGTASISITPSPPNHITMSSSSPIFAPYLWGVTPKTSKETCHSFQKHSRIPTGDGGVNSGIAEGISNTMIGYMDTSSGLSRDWTRRMGSSGMPFTSRWTNDGEFRIEWKS